MGDYKPSLINGEHPEAGNAQQGESQLQRLNEMGFQSKGGGKQQSEHGI